MRYRNWRLFFIFKHSLVIPLLLTILSGCSTQQTHTPAPKKATSKPYNIKGKTYQPQEHFEYDETGIASYYGKRDGFHGKKTSTGETFQEHDLTAAHKTLPLPSVVRVTNMDNGRSLLLKVNDRGPFVDGRIIDVSSKAARMLGFYNKGTAKVRVQSLVEESIAMQGTPKGYIPIVVASADTSHLPETQTISMKREVVNFKNLPVQQLLADASGASKGMNPPVPERRPGWLAIKELLQPSTQEKAFAQAPMNENATVSLASATAPSATANGIFVQAGTFSKYKNAERLSHKLKTLARDIPVRLNTVAINQTPMFTVRLGPVRSSENAEKIIQQMAQAGHYDAQIIYE